MVGNVVGRTICVINSQNMERLVITTFPEIHTEREIVVLALFAL